MKISPLYLLPFFTTLLLAGEETEPALGFTLHMGGKEIRLAPNKEEEIKGSFTNPKATLVPDEFRRFTYGGISFKYPSDFAFEADFTNEGAKLWSLDGKDFIIMIHTYEEDGITAKSYAAELKQLFGPGPKLEEITYTFNGKKHIGMRLIANIAGVTLFQDVLALPGKKGSRLMILQDHPAEEKVSEKERKTVLDYLDKTLRY